MRHKVVKHSFGRKPGPRKALIRGLVDALVEHGRIKTTVPKAKELRRHVEKAVTKGKNDTPNARRVLLSKYPNQKTVKSIIENIGPRFKDRTGGYTRIIKLGPRQGDCADMAYIEFVDYERPDLSQEEREQKLAAQERVAAKRKASHRRSVRNIQNDSRKINR